MTTTHASTHAPKPAEAASKPAQQGGSARANAEKPAEDLFASLLSLVSDTHQTPANALPDGEATNDPQAEADDKTDDNPLAALLAWALPGGASPTGTASATTPSGAAEGAAREGGIDVSGMTRVDEAAPALPNAAAQARAAAASRPAFSPLNPNHVQPPATGVTAQRAVDGNALPGGAPAMVWQRGAVSSTEALQQQQSAQFAQVRATVALNERLGVSAGAEASAGPTGPREFTLSGPASTSATGPALDGSQTAASGTAPGDSSGSGDPSSQASTDQGQGDGRPHADASAEAEGPTVSHWGTQHMRHASLRVGGEGADAIDIQLAVKGQEVQVAFQTDNAEARATLRESAGESLADLLQRSGIQLGGVSVGSQGQAQGDGSSYQPRSAGLSTEALGRASQAAEPAAPAAPRPRADGSRPLDVFA